MSSPQVAIDIAVFTIFPEMIVNGVSHSLVGKAIDRGLVSVNAIDLRDHTDDPHKTVDDSPSGGGAGMVMKCDPFFRAMETHQRNGPIVALSPRGRPFNQSVASEFSRCESLTLLCGRYEGIDERVHTQLCTDVVSIGDFVLNGGEIAALAIIESVTRLLPSMIGNAQSLDDESFNDGLLEYPHYTRPADYRGLPVPSVLQSGDHERIRSWRRLQRLIQTRSRRPDLFAVDQLSTQDRELLREFDARSGETNSDIGNNAP